MGRFLAQSLAMRMLTAGRLRTLGVGMKRRQHAFTPQLGKNIDDHVDKARLLLAA